MIVYLRYVRGVLDWERECPRVIQAATLTGLVSTVAWAMTLWPVYGGWTLPLMFTLFMAFCNLFHFLPAF